MRMTPYNKAVPDNVRQAADAVQKGIIDGGWNPFQGPITDNKGKSRLAAGKALGDGDLHKMDWYVEGVEG